MKQARQALTLICVLFLVLTLLAACGNSAEPTPAANTAATAAAGNPEPSPSASAVPPDTAAMRSYTDSIGHTVEIPAAPKRIIFWGETYGDLLALDMQAIGTSTQMTKNQIYEDQLAGVEDVGFPINLEKTLELQPDLIIYAGMEEADFEALSRISPTVIFNTFAPLKERMLELGNILGKTQEAEAWLAEYKAREAAMWEQLAEAGVKPDETASVFTYYPGDRLFVMAATGLSQVLYEENGFKATPGIQVLLDEKKGFEQISIELLQEYAGDRIFILNPMVDEARKSTEQLMKSEIWKNLPAVKKGQVYFQDIEKTSADATTREWLLQELPQLLGK